MSSEMPPESESTENSIPGGVHEWIRIFIKNLELNFSDAYRGLPEAPSQSDLEEPAIRTIILTLLESDSRINMESILEIMGQIWAEHNTQSTEWNAKLNQRRFELIDKEIQEKISTAESIELAGLTNLMRKHVDSEENLPMKGAKELHRKLLELNYKDKHH
ncbi:hypothetical protein [Gimesia fumaroli]|uniref:Uncharacterized protein n=1 Tax=Gimesia fumaroli TaxID=2527976 RepID=A0A518IFB9_9PLAN|nr:hypothetical protein [Gimesia fumaroli]QDV51784.1 hypothetical protein Enr17x_38420 [Gimesia fumaroli]